MATKENEKDLNNGGDEREIHVIAVGIRPDLRRVAAVDVSAQRHVLEPSAHLEAGVSGGSPGRIHYANRYAE